VYHFETLVSGRLREAIKNWTEVQHLRVCIDLPGLRHGKLFIGGPCKKRADDLLKLSRHQLKMVTAIYTGHAPVRGHLYTMVLFDGILWSCLMGIQSAVFVGRRLKQCSTLFAVARRWLDSVIMSLGG